MSTHKNKNKNRTGEETKQQRAPQQSQSQSRRPPLPHLGVFHDPSGPSRREPTFRAACDLSHLTTENKKKHASFQCFKRSPICLFQEHCCVVRLPPETAASQLALTWGSA